MAERVRFDLDLTDEDLEALEELQRITNRSRKNLCESLVLLAIKTHQENGSLISMSDLGKITED